MGEDMATTHRESDISSEKLGAQYTEFDESGFGVEAQRLRTIEIENYHGLHLKTILVYLSVTLIGFTQLLNLVGTGAYAQDVAAVVGGAGQATWLSQSLAITTAVLGPIVSEAADYWGRKWLLVILTVFGFVGAMVTARATTMGMAIAGEVIFGVSYGAQPLLYAIISEIIPRRYRPVAQGGFTAALAVGAIVGLLGGSVMIRDYNEGFRIFWYFNAALLGLAVPICALIYNPPLRPLQTSLSTKQKLLKLDWVAYILLTIGVVLFALGLSWAENPYPWSSAEVLAPLIVGAITLVFLAIHQTIFKKDGLFHHDLFKNDRNMALSLVVIFGEGLVFFAANFYFAYEVGIEWETDTIRVGLRFCIVFIASGVFAMVAAAYSSYRKAFRGPIIAAFIAFTLFYALMASATTGSSQAVWGYAVVLGFGLGMALTSLISVAQLSAPPHLISTSSGLFISIRSLGGSVSLAICGAIFNNHVNSHLATDIASAVLPLGLPEDALPALLGGLAANNPAMLFAIPGVTPQIVGAAGAALQSSYIGAFRGVWIFAAAMSFVAAIASLFFVNPKKDMTMHVDASLEE